MNPLAWYVARLSPVRGDLMQTYEAEQPWIIYTYGACHDKFWPPWRSTRVLGVTNIGMECAVCGQRQAAVLRIPRFGAIPEPEGGRHKTRLRFMLDHLHEDRGHQMSWARPLLNPMAGGGLDLDLLKMRLEADLAGE